VSIPVQGSNDHYMKGTLKKWQATAGKSDSETLWTKKKR